MPRIQISGKEWPIEKVFGREFVFSIPLYQRPYAWGEEQTQELLDDLLGFLGTGTEPIDDLNPYFLGSIVVIKREEHRPEADVVDGQQRLTTLTILLSAIRNRLTGETDGAHVRFGNGLTDYIYERGGEVFETPDRFRLTLRDADKVFFQDHIQRPGQIDSLLAHAGRLSDSQKNIKCNTRFLVNRLNALTADQCKRLARFVLRQCFLVVVSTPDEGSAFRIFMVLNTRGLDLLPSDVLKSKIIGEIPQADRERYSKQWENTENLLGRDSFANLFAYIRMIYLKSKPKRTLLEEFLEFVLPQEPNRMRLVDDVLVPFAEAYSDIKGAKYQSATGADEINRLFKWLNRIDNTDWLPPAILYMRRNSNDPTALKRFFTDFERLAAILMLLRAGVNNRIERYGRVITAIENGVDLYGPDSPLQLTAAENQNAINALNGDVYHLLPKLRTYILLRLDTELSSGGATYDYDLITVEHVLPQKPDAGSQWETWWPDPLVRADWVHRLGNLALLTHKKNASASNLEFDLKKSSYFLKGGVSRFTITTRVVTKEEWTPAVVQRWQIELVDALKRVWRLKELVLTVPARVEVKAGEVKSFPVKVARENVEGGVAVEFEAPPGVTLNMITINADQSTGQASVTAGAQANEQDYAVKAMASCGTVTATHQNMIVRVTRD